VPVRSDKIPRPGDVADQIFAHLRDDPLVIADITGGNPNVMYELGARHTRHHASIQLAEEETRDRILALPGWENAGPA
jgi:hypothetical protein